MSPSPKLLRLGAWTLAVALPLAATASPPRRVADLKSLFHGESAPPSKAPPPKVLAVVSTAAGLAPDPQIEDFFRAFAAALHARDGQRMLPRLAAAYTVADLPEDHPAAGFFAQAIELTPGPEALVIQSIEPKGSTRVVKVEFRYPTKARVKTFQFDAEGRLLASDLFVLKRTEHGL